MKWCAAVFVDVYMYDCFHLFIHSNISCSNQCPNPINQMCGTPTPLQHCCKRRHCRKRKRRAPSPKLSFMCQSSLNRDEICSTLQQPHLRPFGSLTPQLSSIAIFPEAPPKVAWESTPLFWSPLSLQDLLKILENRGIFATSIYDAIATILRRTWYKDDTLAARVSLLQEFYKAGTPLALIRVQEKKVCRKHWKSRACGSCVARGTRRVILQQISHLQTIPIHSLLASSSRWIWWRRGSIRILLAPEAVVWRLFPILQTRLSVLCGMRITHVQVIGQFVVETESGKLTYWDQVGVRSFCLCTGLRCAVFGSL